MDTRPIPHILENSLPEPSEEQKEIIEYFNKGYNLKIEASAGAGKSTTLLWLARTAKEKYNQHCLLITYNKSLQTEVAQKLKQSKLDSHCAVYTYHGLASRLYGTSIHTDIMLRSCLNRNTNFATKTSSIILLDEVQDMNSDYCKLVQSLLSHGKMLALVGDSKQCINTYIGASTQYLINYTNYFDTGRPWKELSLRTSYRLTPLISNFLNNHIIGDNLIIGGNNVNRDLKPIYRVGAFGFRSLVERMARRYGSDQVAILNPTIKKISPKSPLGQLLGQKSTVLFAIMDENSSHETTQGKVVVSTFNAFKGNERDCVFVMNFDESYFDYYAKDWDQNNKQVPNIIYVAASRAKEQLIVIQDDRKRPFRTIKQSELSIDCEIEGNQKDPDKPVTKKPRTYAVTDLSRHRHLDDMEAMLSLLTITTITPIGTSLSTQDIIQFPGYSEDVCMFNGTLIPLYYQHLQSKPLLWLQQFTIDKMHETQPYFDDKSNEMIYFKPTNGSFDDVFNRLNQLFNIPEKTIQQWMEMVVLNTAVGTRCHFYKDQITNYKWVDTNFINAGVERLASTIPPNGEFEVYFKSTEACSIEGFADYVVDDELWEFKCTNSLTDEHKIQCGAYLALYFLKYAKTMIGKLFNIKTGEILEIKLKDPKLFLDVFTRKSTDIPE